MIVYILSQLSVYLYPPPSAITYQYADIYTGWTLHSNTRGKHGYFQLIHEDCVNHTTFSTYVEGELWHHYDMEAPSITKPTVCRLSSHAEYELWHHRLGHPNATYLCNMHKYARGVPELKQLAFHKCPSCSINIKKDTSAPIKHSRPTINKAEDCIRPGQHMHIYFGFVRGSKYKRKDDKGRLVTILDGFRSYLIVYRATRYK